MKYLNYCDFNNQIPKNIFSVSQEISFYQRIEKFPTISSRIHARLPWNIASALIFDILITGSFIKFIKQPSFTPRTCSAWSIPRFIAKGKKCWLPKDWKLLHFSSSELNVHPNTFDPFDVADELKSQEYSCFASW